MKALCIMTEFQFRNLLPLPLPPFSNLSHSPGDYADSMCSSDEEEIRNRIGNIPMEWYDEYDHIG